MRTDLFDAGAWRRRLVRALLSAALFVAGVSWLPYWWCSRPADAWYRGDATLQSALANGVDAHVRRDLGRHNFKTGSDQFNGEWLFGTYLMAGLGFGQTAIEHPEWRAQNAARMRLCIQRLLTPEVRAFDTETWHSDALETLEERPAHAAYLGYLNLLLGFHRIVAPDSEYAALNDRITAALVRRLEKSRILLLESYPGEIYPVDNCAVVGSIGLHGLASGANHKALLDLWSATCRARYVDPRSGLLYQGVETGSAEPADDPRGSGTCLGLYFLSFADPVLSRDLYNSVRKNLARTVLGFGGVREYPGSVHGGTGDIDSGPVVLGFGLSPTGFLIAGTRLYADPGYFKRLYATAHAWGAPYARDGKMNFVTGGSLGDAILFAMLTAMPPDRIAQYAAAAGPQAKGGAP